MANDEEYLNEFFSVPGEATLPSEILGELESIARLHSLPAQEVFFKWESYCIKMGSEDTKLNYDTVRAFKKDIQETLERDARGKNHARGTEKRSVHATPRAGASSKDVLGMIDGMSPATPRLPSTNGASKRKAPYETPAPPKVARAAGRSSPTDGRTPLLGSGVPFKDRPNAGQRIETLNDHLAAFEPPLAPPCEPRIKLKANTDMPKFAYKPLAMHLSEASEVLDDRIDEFAEAVQRQHKLDDGAFGNAASKSASEVVAVGRVASDTPDAKPNAESLVLEMSRRTGAGLRVPLRFNEGVSGGFFPGQIVALRGANASGEYFQVESVLDLPIPPPAATAPAAIDATNERLGVDDPSHTTPSQALNIITTAGPYTADDNLDFEPLHALCERAITSCADALILVGPFLDTEHPRVALGDFELPADAAVEPDKATLTDAFRVLIGTALARVAHAVPSITILLVPSARDAVSKHVAWPQDALARKGLGLPRQARCVTNPIVISLNEVVVGVSAQDVFFDLRREEVNIGAPKEPNLFARLARYVIQQAHFFPLFPPVNRALLPKPGLDGEVATGTPIDISYLKLAEWPSVRPDVLIMPSSLPPFAKVVESVLVANPGTLSKKKGAGTFVQMAIHPRKLTDEERAAPRAVVGNNIFERARVDAIRI